MTKGGFDTIIDNINTRSKEDVVGVKAKKSDELKEKTGKSGGGYSLIGMVDKIRDRDDDKIYNRGVYKEDEEDVEKTGDETTVEKKEKNGEKEKKERKTGGLAIDSMLDRIRNRDDDNASGLTPKKTASKKEIME